MGVVEVGAGANVLVGECVFVVGVEENVVVGLIDELGVGGDLRDVVVKVAAGNDVCEGKVELRGWELAQGVIEHADYEYNIDRAGRSRVCQLVQPKTQKCAEISNHTHY